MLNETVLPIPPQYFWTILSVLGMLLGSILVFLILPRTSSRDANNSSERIKAQLGLEGLSDAVLLFGVSLWGIVFVAVLFGFVLTIWETLLSSSLKNAEQVFDWRISVAVLTASTATLGAVVALPITLIRLGLTARQTANSEDALFNDKLNAAAANLAARRQSTRTSLKEGQEIILTEWEDDLVLRSSAIDRLESLAAERSSEASRVIRLLAAYVREASSGSSVYSSLSELDHPEAVKYANENRSNRSDITAAIKTISRLPKNYVDDFVDETNLERSRLQFLTFNFDKFEGFILDRANLDGCNFWETRLEECRFDYANATAAFFGDSNIISSSFKATNLVYADFVNARITNCRFRDALCFQADFRTAKIQHSSFQGIKFSEANFRSAYLNRVFFSGTESIEEMDFGGAGFKNISLNTMIELEPHWKYIFADGSCEFPEGVSRPSHWPLENLEKEEFDQCWRKWRIENEYSVGRVW